MILPSWLVLSPAAVMAAVLSGMAMYLVLHHPGDQLRRTSVGETAVLRSERRVSRAFGGRPEAPSLGRRLMLCGLCAGALCLVAARLREGPGPLAWVAWPLLTTGGALALGWLEPQLVRRRQRDLVLQVPQALELMAACLGAGMPVRAACRAIVGAFDGPVGEDLGRVLALVDLGVSDADAWSQLHDHPQLGPAADDLARSIDSGTLLVQGLRQHAAAARDARRSLLLVRARSVGVRSVLPLMICFLPSFMLLGVVPTVVSAIRHALP
jgi:Flp pilus assembly protein TadB